MAASLVRKTTGQATSTVLTLNIQADGTERALIFAVAYKSNSVLTEDSIVFNTSENFNLVSRATDGGDAQVSIYELPNPTATTANAVITFPSSVRMVGIVYHFTGVDQTNPIEPTSIAEAQGINNAPSRTLVNPSGNIGVDILAQVSAGPDTIDSNSGILQLDLGETGGGTDIRGGSQSNTGINPTMSYGMSSTDHWNIIAVSVRPPTAGETFDETGLQVLIAAIETSSDQLIMKELLLSEVIGSLTSQTDVLIFLELLKSETFSSIQSQTENFIFLELLKGVTGIGITSQSDQLTMKELLLSQIVGSIISQTDVQTFIETGLQETIGSVTSQTENFILLELLKSVIINSATSQTENFILLELAKSVTIVGVTSSNDALTLIELDKEVVISAIISETDIQTFIETGGQVIIISVISGTDDFIPSSDFVSGGRSILAMLEASRL